MHEETAMNNYPKGKNYSLLFDFMGRIPTAHGL